MFEAQYQYPQGFEQAHPMGVWGAGAGVQQQPFMGPAFGAQQAFQTYPQARRSSRSSRQRGGPVQCPPGLRPDQILCTINKFGNRQYRYSPTGGGRGVGLSPQCIDQAGIYAEDVECTPSAALQAAMGMPEQPRRRPSALGAFALGAAAGAAPFVVAQTARSRAGAAPAAAYAQQYQQPQYAPMAARPASLQRRSSGRGLTLAPPAAPAPAAMPAALRRRPSFPWVGGAEF